MENERSRLANSYARRELPSNDRNASETLQQVNNQLTNLYERQRSYGSASISLDVNSSQNSSSSKKRMSKVRRTFLLIVTFDLIFIILLWIIYNQIFNNAIDAAFEIEVIKYKIHNSSFDIVVVSALRFISLMIAYALFKWSHWIFVVFTTLSSTGFIIAKTCLFTIYTVTDKSGIYILVLASFIIAWIEIWFFDYRVIPHERRLKEAINQSERRRLLSGTGSGSLSPIPVVPKERTVTISSERHQSFYSAIHSLDTSDTEEVTDQPIRNNIRSDSNVSQSILGTPSSVPDDVNHEEYENQAEEILEETWRIYNDETGWNEESKSKDGLDIVFSKTFPKWGKVFRLISTVTGSRDDIVQMLFERQEDIPKWSSSVNDCRILEEINRNLYITYQLTSEQAQGIIAKRDFVNIAVRRYIDEVAILAAQACVYPRMSMKDNVVRAENGPTAYVLEKIDESTCRFTWILNVDLKGWLPQYLINNSLAGAQLNLVESLRNYLSKTADFTSTCSSSTDENTV